MAAVAVSELTARLGDRTVLHGVNCRLDGGVVVLAGPNGAGKSTLLRILATLLPFDGGAEVAGCDLSNPSGRRQARQRLGFLPQEAAFPGDFTVEEAVGYSGWLHRVAVAERRARVAGAIEAVGLTDRSTEPLRTLSTGLRRRAFLAQALVHQPPVLLLDEPTAGVDVEHRTEFRRLVRRLAEGRLVVLSTHLTEEIEFLADRVVVLSAGRVCFDGAPADLAAGAETPAGDERRVEAALRRLTGESATPEMGS
ncbi:MAG: ABC transporter ATP-binding protein [Acidimicrobiia bacterium]